MDKEICSVYEKPIYRMKDGASNCDNVKYNVSEVWMLLNDVNR